MPKKLIDNNFRFDACPLCGDNKIKCIGKITYAENTMFSTFELSLTRTPELWVCKTCFSRFTQNAIPEETATQLYEEGNGLERWVSISFKDEKTPAVLRELDRHFHQGVTVMDVGCNMGGLLDYAQNRGCITYGVELSASSREVLGQKGHNSFATIEEVKGHFDVITAFDLVEHLYNVPLFLKKCYERLNNGGTLIILTGDISCFSSGLFQAGWWYVRYPEHVIFPSLRYYKKLPGFRLRQGIKTFDSQRSRLSSDNLKRIRGLIKAGNYSGRPSVVPDHILIVLEKIPVT